MGDMNSLPDDPQIQRLLATPGVTDAIASGMPQPPSHIDWIFTRGLQTVAAGMIDHGASDHPCYWAELEVRD